MRLTQSHKGQSQASSALRLLLVLSLALAPGTMTLGDDSADSPPRVTWRFGFLPQKSEVSRVFHVVNTDTEPMNITDIKSGCSCTSVSDVTGPVLPGDSVPIVVTFKTGRYKNRVVKTTRVFTDLASAPELQYRIEAYVFQRGKHSRAIRTAPDELVWNLGDSLVAPDTITIVNTSDQPVTVSLVAFPNDLAELTALPSAVDPGATAPMILTRITDRPTEHRAESITLTFIGADTTTVTVPITIED
jgi:Protein of unknown function (DUF1573)